MDNLQLRKAIADDSEFAYQARKVAFREYVEQTSGWNEDEQRQLHLKRFASLILSGDTGIRARHRDIICESTTGTTVKRSANCLFYRSTRVGELAEWQ